MNFVQFNASNWINLAASKLILHDDDQTKDFDLLAIILLVVSALDTLIMTLLYVYLFYKLEKRFPVTMAYIPSSIEDANGTSIDGIPRTASTAGISVRASNDEQDVMKYSQPAPKVAAFDSSESVVADLRPFNPSIIGNYRPRSTILPAKMKLSKNQ